MELSSLINDHMIIQRHQPIIISGRDQANETIRVIFLEQTYTTATSANGNWSVILDPAEPGGPYQMEIIGTEKKRISDILVGDVWVLGGQSNMELPVHRTLDLFSEEMKMVNQPQIRQFSVPQNYNFHQPKKQLSGGKWLKAAAEDVLNFSAVGYFFAEKIYQEHDIPIGLIQTAVGGTPIEAWMREETLRQLGTYNQVLDQSKNDDWIQETIKQEEERQQQWHQQLDRNDQGLLEKWFNPSVDTSDWQTFALPHSWQDTALEQIKGAVWFQKTIELSDSVTEKGAMLKLGTIVDADQTYVNGHLVGQTGYKYPPRRYQIPKGILKSGKNTITVRVISTESTGGFITDMPYQLITDKQNISLIGSWKYRIGTITKPLIPSTFFRNNPAGLFNEMIAPIGNYPITGVLWYQGETNTHQPKGYHKLFEKLVEDWRQNWQIGDFPFIFTQLANLETGEDQQESHWAMLRDEQRQSLQVENTAMAVTIDVGEYNDLHPQDKKTVGQRLAKCANVLAYKQKIEYMGPLYKSHQINNDTIEITFDHIGSGLAIRGDALNGFTMAGADKQFLPAQARRIENKVIVSHSQIKSPKHVRYAWADNPEQANLYNKEGLPASPFTTETE
ncbi:sialate O-acetylesterase [Amphibacillus sp. Q70]|uniref:sialate O-acetylesterase n=1 Tax=Amphibacillus sp. Q70 TaxID=3453416 RepID=UPI003F8565F7